ncbi:unnamed protein product [Arabidopsis lyrata]|nr:unnamed protein product [Arabidopsis lyrata]
MVSFIEFPIFDGVSGDLRPWISWLEDFFVRENFTALEKLNLAQSLLEGEAEAWFYSSRNRFIFQSWEHLMDLMIWRFGDFSDPELFLLFDKNDRLLQKQIDDAKLRRMSRTAITPHESISSPATIQETIPVDKFSNQQVDEISGEKKESKKEVDLSLGTIASQLKLPNTKVHVSDSENLRNIETRIENSVLDNFETVVKEAKIQKNIRMDVVNGNVERIQRVMSISKNVSAHQVLNKMCQLKRLQPKNKKKLSLSLKTWMFKFKHKILLWSRSQTDPHQAMDSNIIKYISSSSRAKFGYKWKEYNSRYWRRMRQTHMSRLLCLYQTNAEKALEALKEIQSQQATVMRDGTTVSSLPAKELVPGDIVELRVGDKVPADMRVLALISSTLRVEQGSLTGESEAVSKTTKPVDENADIQGNKCMVFAGTTVICSDKTGTLTTNQMAVSKLVAMGSRIGTLRSFNVEGTSFDPRDGKIEDWPAGRMDANLQMIAKVAAICNDASVEQSDQQFVSRGMPIEAALKVLVENMGFSEGLNKASSNGDALRCCRLWSELEQRIATLEFDRDRKSMGVMVDSSSGNKFLLVKGAVENVLDRSTRIQLLADVSDFSKIPLLYGTAGDASLCSSCICGRRIVGTRGGSCCQDFASLYPAFKLEDKLVFWGESIDTIQGLVDDVAESSSQRKDSNCERSFAVELQILNKRRKQSSLLFLMHFINTGPLMEDLPSLVWREPALLSAERQRGATLPNSTYSAMFNVSRRDDLTVQQQIARNISHTLAANRTMYGCNIRSSGGDGGSYSRDRGHGIGGGSSARGMSTAATTNGGGTSRSNVQSETQPSTLPLEFSIETLDSKLGF